MEFSSIIIIQSEFILRQELYSFSFVLNVRRCVCVCLLTASGKPADVHVVILKCLGVDEQKYLLCLLVVASSSLGLSKVEVE